VAVAVNLPFSYYKIDFTAETQ